MSKISSRGWRRWLFVALAAPAIGCQTMSPCNDCQPGPFSGSRLRGVGEGIAGNGEGADFGDRFRNRMDTIDYEQVYPDHCWPTQYARESRRRVNEPFGRQLQEGNALEQTIWAHYFSDTKGKETELNEAGIKRLRYLARRRPYVIPNLYMESSYDPELDSKRTQVVLDYMKTINTQDTSWQLTVVQRDPVGIMGREAATNILKITGFPQGTIPTLPYYEPVIKPGFYAGSGGGGAGGGGGGGQ